MTEVLSFEILNALPHAMLTLDREGVILHANAAAEVLFGMSLMLLKRQRLHDLFTYDSPVVMLFEAMQQKGTPVAEYKVQLDMPRQPKAEKVVDVHLCPLLDGSGQGIALFQGRSMAEAIDRQQVHRSAARSVSGMAAMLAHEIKNPLSGIRGAAQLLETSANEQDQVLTRLIRDETDRIVKLVDRIEVFSDERPLERSAVNIHGVLDHVKRLAQAGFAKHVRFSEDYDPSLPLVYANRDQLVQVFLNLVKNAAEAIPTEQVDGEITLTTAYRPGVRFAVPGTQTRVSLPLQFTVRDNGKGIPDTLLPNLFDPFVTTKTNGSGLGLALVAKVISDHGGVVECTSQPKRTVFSILMPKYDGEAA